MPPERRQRRVEAQERPSTIIRGLHLALKHPAEVVGVGIMTLMVVAILQNALWGQRSAHPAPFFRPSASQPAAQAASPRSESDISPQEAARRRLLVGIQSELAELGLYAGDPDGVMGPRTAAAIKSYQTSAGLESDGLASDDLLAILRRRDSDTTASAPPKDRPKPAKTAKSKDDPIAALIQADGRTTSTQNTRTLRIKKALSALGYGPLKADGVYDDKTRLAIARFETDNDLPVTGKVSSRLEKALMGSKSSGQQ